MTNDWSLPHDTADHFFVSDDVAGSRPGADKTRAELRLCLVSQCASDPICWLVGWPTDWPTSKKANICLSALWLAPVSQYRLYGVR